MLKIKPNPTFPATIIIPVPGSDPVPVRVEFRYLKRSEQADIFDGPGEDAELQKTTRASVLQRDTELVQRLLSGWSEDDTGAEFSPEAVAEMIDVLPGAASAIVRGFFDAISEARTGN